MEWFKHAVDSHDDPDLFKAMTLYGDAAYVIFFVIIELYAREYRNASDGWLEFDKSFLCHKLRKRWTRVQLLLSFYETLGRFLIEESKTTVRIKIPKFGELTSTWTARQENIRRRAPLEAPTAIRSKNKEEDKRKDKKKRKRRPHREDECVCLMGDVFLKTDEIEALTDDWGRAGFNLIIKTLHDYKLATGRTYKNDYGAINMWVIKKLTKDGEIRRQVASPAKKKKEEVPISEDEEREGRQFIEEISRRVRNGRIIESASGDEERLCELRRQRERILSGGSEETTSCDKKHGTHDENISR